jgi:AsmA protein
MYPACWGNDEKTMRKIKILGLLVAGIIACALLLLLAVALIVNPNDYKERIEQQVKTTTGRELTLRGDIKLSVFPWIALELGPASLGNPEGFGKEPFLSVQRAALRVRLLPLLHKELQVGRIEIDGLDLRLKKNAAGKGNWEDFGQMQAPASVGQTRQSSESLEGLGGIEITQSRISYEAITISNLNVDVGNLSQHAAVPVKASFDFDSGAGGNSLSLASAFTVTPDMPVKRYGLAGVTLSGKLKLKNDNRSLPWEFVAHSVDLDLAAQTLKAPAFSAQAGPAQLSGSMAGDKILDAPAIGGSFKLEPLVLREFLARIGVEPPKTRDEKAFSKLAFSTHFSYAMKTLRLTQLDVQLDDSQLRGSLMLTNPETLANEFDLNVDRINVDRYRAPETAEAKTDQSSRAAEKPTELPTSALKALNTRGSFSIGSATVAGMSLSNLKLGVSAREGVVHLSPIKASLYGGQYSGDITYDAHESTPRLALEQEVTGVDMAPLLKDSIKSERLSGRGNASAKLAGQGRTSDALIKDLSGRVQADLVDGAVNGIDLWFEISRAQALLKQQTLASGNDDRRTKFDRFKMSADIAGGIATTKDLMIASQYLRVTGTGTANLLTKGIDYHILATILKALPSAHGADLSQLTLAGIPVEISGTMSDPKVRPDLAGLLKSNVKQKLEDTLKNKLQGLFNK